MRACRITSFQMDANGHWVASLDCGHAQHVRHEPPLESRPWVMTDEGRTEHLGAELSCRSCAQDHKPEA